MFNQQHWMKPEKVCQTKSYSLSNQPWLSFNLYFIQEFIPNFAAQWPIRRKLFQLIRGAQKKAEEQKKCFAIFIDEMPLYFFENQDYEDLLISWNTTYPRVFLFLSISPSGRYLYDPIEVIFKRQDKIFARQLLTRHRNSFLLSSFLIHLTYSYNKLEQTSFRFQCLSPINDAPLDASKLPHGEITLWYHQSKDISDIEILQFLYSTYLPKEGQVLVSPYTQNLSQSVYDWCLEKRWDVVSHGNMTGSERDLVIVFADNIFGNLEVMSRARKRLIIITRLSYICSCTYT